MKKNILVFVSFLVLFIFLPNAKVGAQTNGFIRDLEVDVDYVPSVLTRKFIDSSVSGNIRPLFLEFNYKLKENEYFVISFDGDINSLNSVYIRLNSINDPNGLDYFKSHKSDQYYFEFRDDIDVSKDNVFYPSSDAQYKAFSNFKVSVYGEIDEIAPQKITNVRHLFNEDNSVTYEYDLPADDDFSHLEIYQDNQLLKDDYKLNSIKISDLTPEMSYKFKFVSVDTSGNKSEPFISSVTSPSGPDLIAPLEVSEIKKVVSGTSIQFSYKLPIDNDFSHVQVWRNNIMIADNLKINSFNDNDLDYDTTYNYMFKSVDFTGNVSNGSSLTVKTMPEIDEIAPLSPVGVDVVNGNASLFLSWSASPESDVVGYNVYVDGVKRNGSPVAGNSFRMTNLVNGQEYSLQVSAVDTSGNESELTQTFVGVPDSAKLPVFKVDTDLSAVSKSTENWFSQLWLVTAFSASIPIAFFVGGRIKALFFA